jgi:hypothetical protein
VTLTNESLNNDNFVDLVVGEIEVTVPIDELVSALIAFERLRIANRENLGI